MKLNPMSTPCCAGLTPSGDTGFEGLIAVLLEKLTGERFFLAVSGRQAGRDMRSSGLRKTNIAVECKRYKENTSLDERDILGELEQAFINAPDLDVWALVATRAISDQLYSSLRSSAENKGIEIVFIETNDGEPSSLSALCASAPDFTANHINHNAKNVSNSEIEKLQTSLDIISSHSQFDEKVSRLRENISSQTVGYDSWRRSCNSWLCKVMSSKEEAESPIGLIQVLGQEEKLIKRRKAFTELDRWYSEWPTKSEAFAMLGEEGDGKSWAVASWLSQRMKKSDFPAVIFANSGFPYFNKTSG